MSAKVFLEKRFREWELLLDSLSSELLDKFTDISNEFDAISTLYKIHGIRKIFLKWLLDEMSNEANCLMTKSQTQSAQWRVKGNDYFNKGDMDNALKYYNLSILSAPRTDQTFPLALANRAAVLMKISKYKEAISDVELSLQYGYPHERRSKLMFRHKQCSTALASQCNTTVCIQGRDGEELTRMNNFLNTLKSNTPREDMYKNISQLLPDKHQSLEGASAALTLKYSDDKGRYIQANKDIKSGEILFVEKPYAFVALPGPNGVLSVVCEMCCKTDIFPIPCIVCNGSVYCGERCREEGWELFHRFECVGTQLLLWPSIGIAHLALRVLLVASKEKFGVCNDINFETMDTQQILKCIDKENKQPQSMNGYHRVYNLLTNFDQMAKKDLLQYALTSVMLTEYLNLQKNDSHIRGCENSMVSSVLILRHLGQLVSSGHAVCGIDQRVATAIYPSASMMNHSCAHNITNSYLGSILVVRASGQGICEGSEVNNCYGPHYTREGGDTRRDHLLSQYHFNCSCSACISPLLDHFANTFSAFVCDDCSSPVLKQYDFKCHNCGKKQDTQHVDRLYVKSQQIYKQAEKYEGEEAIAALKQVREIQNKILYPKHMELRKTNDSLAKHLVLAGQLDEGINLMEKGLIIVKEQFGEESPEFGHELQKLSDVLLMKLKSTSLPLDRELQCKLKTINSTVLDIFYIIYGPWSNTYNEVYNTLNFIETLK